MKRLCWRMKELYFRISVNAKFTLFFTVLSVLFVMVSSLVYFGYSYHSLVEQIVKNSATNLAMTAQQIEFIFEDAKSYSVFIAIENDLQEILTQMKYCNERDRYNYERELNVILKRIPRGNRMMKVIELVDRENNQFSSYGRNVFEGYDRNDLESFWRQKAPTEICETSVLNIPLTRVETLENGILFRSKICSIQSGKPLAILQIIIDEEDLSELLQIVSSNPRDEVFIVNKSGKILCSAKQKALYESVSKEAYFPYLSQNPQNKIMRLNGEKRLLLSRPLLKDWTLVANFSLETIGTELQSMTSTYLLLTLALLTGIVLITPLVSKLILRPLIILKNAITKVSSGARDVQIHIESKDEFGTIAEEFNNMVIKTNDLMNRLIQEQKDKRKYAYMMIQAQINPHFLYNTLETICGLTAQDEKEKTISLIHHLSSFYHNILSKGHNTISMQDELAITENYLEILKIRFFHRFDYQILSHCNAKEYSCLKLIVQPLVENSFQHGFQTMDTGGFIRVIAEEQPHSMAFIVEDNGCGIPETTAHYLLKNDILHQSKSFGIKSINDRIKLYYGPNYGLSILPRLGGGTRMIVTFPKASFPPEEPYLSAKK